MMNVRSSYLHRATIETRCFLTSQRLRYRRIGVPARNVVTSQRDRKCNRMSSHISLWQRQYGGINNNMAVWCRHAYHISYFSYHRPLLNKLFALLWKCCTRKKKIQYILFRRCHVNFSYDQNDQNYSFLLFQLMHIIIKSCFVCFPAVTTHCGCIFTVR
jgi:hypothetical protein